MLIATAESFLGTPYRLGGLDRRGLDCSGLVYVSFREGLNISIPRTSGSLHSWAARINSAERQPGDLLFFVTAGSRVSHVAIYVGGGRFIHSASEGPRTGVILSGLDESYWRRTYLSSGRALPWEAEAAETVTSNPTGGTPRPGGNSPSPGGSIPEVNVSREPVWADPGFFVGFAAAWTWGGIFEGASSPFRGISTIASAGYKWSSFRAGLELRPEWDNALGVFRLPITLSAGTDNFQVFGGPAYTFGDPSLSLGNRDRHYSGGNSWLWEVGASAALSPVNVGRGAISLYAELALQPYSRGNGESFDFRHDFTANLRASTGIRYLWRLR